MLQSKSGEDLTRYFPELVDAARELKASRFALDGEIVVSSGRMFSFDDLLQQIHPAASRVARLSRETPALLIVFDLLASGKTDLTGQTLMERRASLERFAHVFKASPNFRPSACTTRYAQALRWLRNAGGGFDGVIAKRRDLPYAAGSREAMQKIKRYRSADCVIGGFRYAENKLGNRKVGGSLLLGLYDEDGLLHHVGFTSAPSARLVRAHQCLWHFSGCWLGLHQSEMDDAGKGLRDPCACANSPWKLCGRGKGRSSRDFHSRGAIIVYVAGENVPMRTQES